MKQVNIQRLLGQSALYDFSPRVSRAAVEKYWELRNWASRGNRDLFEFSPDVYFVWIPKVAGSSITRWLRKSSGVLELLNVARALSVTKEQLNSNKALTIGHQSSDSLIRIGLLDPEKIERSWSFAVVRNPFSRVASVWKYLIKKRTISPSTTIDDFVDNLLTEQPRIGLYNQHGLSMASPMVQWVNQNHWLGPKEIFRIEDFSSPEVVETLRDRLETIGPIPSSNVSPPSTNHTSIRKETLKKIIEFYQEDFEQFGYSPEDPAVLFSSLKPGS